MLVDDSCHLALKEQPEPDLYPPKAAWKRRLNVDQGDYRAALAWFVARGEIA